MTLPFRQLKLSPNFPIASCTCPSSLGQGLPSPARPAKIPAPHLPGEGRAVAVNAWDWGQIFL